MLTLAARGDTAAARRLIPLVYDELRKLAAGYLRQERPGHTLQPTALVHEASLRLLDYSRLDPKSRTHFMCMAAREMRRALIDHARRHGARKRGADWVKVTLDQVVLPTEGRSVDLLDLTQALEELAVLDPRQAEIVELRFFGGLTEEEVAGHIGLSLRTVEREWRMARAWLHRQLKGKSS